MTINYDAIRCIRVIQQFFIISIAIYQVLVILLVIVPIYTLSLMIAILRDVSSTNNMPYNIYNIYMCVCIEEPHYNVFFSFCRTARSEHLQLLVMMARSDNETHCKSIEFPTRFARQRIANI